MNKPAAGRLYPKGGGAWMNAYGGQGNAIVSEKVPSVKRMNRHPFNIITAEIYDND